MSNQHTISDTPTTPRRIKIFVDGQNLYHRLRMIGLEIVEINWPMFFEGLLAEGEELLEVQWHRPGRIEAFQLTPEKVLINMAERRYPQQKEELLRQYRKKAMPQEIFRELRRFFKQKERWLAFTRQRFSEIDAYYQSLTKKDARICIKHSGVLKVDPYECKWVGEKGVDVAIGSELTKAACKDACDHIILVSGDMDFLWAIHLAQEEGKTVEILQFVHHNQKTPLSPSLMTKVDKRNVIDSKDLPFLPFSGNGQDLKATRTKKAPTHFYRIMRKKVKAAIGRNEAKPAFREILRYLKYNPNDEIEKGIFLLKAKYAAAKKNLKLGLIDASTASSQKQQVLNAIFDFVVELQPAKKGAAQ